MKHIRYLSDSIPICESPENLGLDFIVSDVDYLTTKTCRDCSALLMEHNKRSYEAELTLMNNSRVKREKESLGDVKWILISAMFFTSLFWVVFFLVLWWLLR